MLSTLEIVGIIAITVLVVMSVALVIIGCIYLSKKISTIKKDNTKAPKVNLTKKQKAYLRIRNLNGELEQDPEIVELKTKHADLLK